MIVKPLMRVLAGEAVWPPPIWLMRQAGRYLPEYRAIREGGGGFIARCTTPDLATEVTLQPIRRFGMDGAILFSDILILPWAMGQDVQFVDGAGPVLAPLRCEADLAVLDVARAQDRTAPVMETVRRVRAALPESCTLLGFAGSPFTVACYMVEGGGSRDFAATRTLAYTEPVFFGRLMDMLVEGQRGLSVGADRCRRRCGDAVRHLGRGAAAQRVLPPRGGTDGGDRGRAERALSECAPCWGFRAWPAR